jgi:hypothetical protein
MARATEWEPEVDTGSAWREWGGRRNGARTLRRQRELAKDRIRLQQAELIIEVQKKVSLILGIKLPETEKVS